MNWKREYSNLSSLWLLGNPSGHAHWLTSITFWANKSLSLVELLPCCSAKGLAESAPSWIRNRSKRNRVIGGRSIVSSVLPSPPQPNGLIIGNRAAWARGIAPDIGKHPPLSSCFMVLDSVDEGNLVAQSVVFEAACWLTNFPSFRSFRQIDWNVLKAFPTHRGCGVSFKPCGYIMIPISKLGWCPRVRFQQ